VNFQCKIVERLLKIETNVVMDGGYWSKEERDALACLAKNAGATFHLFYTKVPLEELKKRAIERNKLLSSEFQMNIKDLELAYDKFQEPNIISENFIVKFWLISI
jgi:predicted kinase